MHAASREALTRVGEFLDQTIQSDNTVTVAAQTGMELFEVVDVLDSERSLRIALADSSVDGDQRAGIVEKLFGGKISEPTLAVLKHAASTTWSTPRDLREGLVTLGRRSLLRGAQSQGQLEQVESELFELSRLFGREAKLIQLLSDRGAASNERRGLLANVLYGKVTMFTEALALQAIGRPEKNPIDDVSAISSQAAQLRGRSVARVISAGELNEDQQAALADKLGKIYGREMAVHTEVDPSLLGGAVIRVDDEVIDGSTRSKLDRMRAALA